MKLFTTDFSSKCDQKVLNGKLHFFFAVLFYLWVNLWKGTFKVLVTLKTGQYSMHVHTNNILQVSTMIKFSCFENLSIKTYHQCLQ